MRKQLWVKFLVTYEIAIIPEQRVLAMEMSINIRTITQGMWSNKDTDLTGFKIKDIMSMKKTNRRMIQNNH